MFKKFAWTLTSLLGLCVLCLIVYVVRPEMFQKNRDPYLFLIPDGFQGAVTINYGQLGYPPLAHEGKYTLFEIPRDGVLNTSTPEPQYGLGHDKYYYVDQNGNRTELKPDAIQGSGIGSKQEMRDGKLINLPPVQYFHVQLQNVAQVVSDAHYPSAVVWADSLYLLSVEKVSWDQLDVELGEVKRVMNPMPLTDGDANSLPIGSHFFAIKGHNQYEAIAVESDGEYKKATRESTYR